MIEAADYAIEESMLLIVLAENPQADELSEKL